jgi:hypothetical protein
MKRKYKVDYVWHSGECFGANMWKTTTVELEDEEVDEWKKDFQDWDMDGSYCSINSMKVIEEDC